MIAMGSLIVIRLLQESSCFNGFLPDCLLKIAVSTAKPINVKIQVGCRYGVTYNEQGLLAGLEFIARPPGTAAD
jgi:hypothetical protein